MKNLEAKLLQQLVQIKSLSGGEGKLADFILEYCRKTGVAAIKQKGNVVIHVPGKEHNRALIFNAHMDTVSPGKAGKWKYPPFGSGAGKIAGDKLYGLGASDDKGAIAAMLILAGVTRWIPPTDIWFTFVTNEETDGSGTTDFLEWFTRSHYFKTYKYIAAVIGEPTNLESIEIGHRGNYFIKLTAKGNTGHSGKNYRDEELAVGKMMMALENLKKVFKIWGKKYKDSLLGEPGLNITGINTVTDEVNKIPGLCEAILDIRTTPIFHDQLEALLEEVIGKHVSILALHKPQPPGITSVNSRIVRTFRKYFPEFKSTISLGSTDLSQFSRRGIDVLICGPGDKKVIHTENEYAELSKVEECVKLYKRMIENF